MNGVRVASRKQTWMTSEGLEMVPIAGRLGWWQGRSERKEGASRGPEVEREVRIWMWGLSGKVQGQQEVARILYNV
jgi:hypothetical protein